MAFFEFDDYAAPAHVKSPYRGMVQSEGDNSPRQHWCHSEVVGLLRSGALGMNGHSEGALVTEGSPQRRPLAQRCEAF